MIDVLLAEDVKDQDAACEARGITTETLMENAGFGGSFWLAPRACSTVTVFAG